jgi:transposase
MASQFETKKQLIEEIHRVRRDEGLGLKRLARRFQMSRRTVQRVVKGTWRGIPSLKEGHPRALDAKQERELANAVAARDELLPNWSANMIFLRQIQYHLRQVTRQQPQPTVHSQPQLEEHRLRQH